MSTPLPDGSQGRAPGPAGRLGLATLRQVVVALLAGGVVGYFVVGTLQLRGDTVPFTPWSLPVMMGALGIAALGYAPVLRRRILESRADVTPEMALRALAAGRTLLLGGAAIAGGHLVYAAFFAGRWEAEGPRERIVRALVTVVAAVLLAAGGRQLERACLVPPPDEDDPAA